MSDPNTNTSTMDSTSQPPAQPVAPVQQNQPNPPVTSGANPTQATPTPQPQKPTIHARVFDSIFRSLGGGPIIVNDPVTGKPREIPQTKSQVGKSIVAAALTGLMTPPQYRDTPQGPVRDPGAQLSAGFNAGKDMVKQRDAEAQRQVDEEHSRKLTNVSNNMKLAQQAAAMALQQHTVLNDVVQRNQSTILKDAEEFDSQQGSNDPSQKAILAKGLTVDQAMNMLHGNMTSQNAFIDGTTSVRNPETGVIEDHPTYAVMNPDVKIKLSEASTKELAKFDKQYQDIYEVTGGNVSVPIRAAVAAMHTANSLTSVEGALSGAATELFKAVNPKAKNAPTFDLAAAYKNNVNLRPVIDAAEKSLSGGAAPYQVLAQLQNVPGANDLYKAMGTTSEAVDQYIQEKRNDALEGEAVAKAGGKLAIEKQKEARTDMIVEDTARNILSDPMGISSLQSLTSLKGDMRTRVFNELKKQDPTFNVEAAKTHANTYNSFTAADGKDRREIESYNTFLKHDGNFVSVIRGALNRPQGTPYWVDKPLNWIEQYAGSDPDILEFKARILPVKDEFINFIKGGKAAFLPEVEEMDKIIDPNQSPRALLRVAQTLGETGLDRLDSKNSTYKQNFGTNAPNLFDQLGTEGATKLGLGNRLRTYGINASTPNDANHTLADVPKGKVPFYDKSGAVKGYADDKQGTNFNQW